MHELLTEGSLQRHHPELDEDEEDGRNSIRILPEQSEIYHSLDLASAMQVASPHGQEPLYTNYTRAFKGTLDYILFSPMRIRLMSVAAIPSPQEIEAESGEGLPSAVYPSDHLMLCIDVALSITGSGNIVSNNHRHSQYTGAGAAGGAGTGSGSGSGSSQRKPVAAPVLGGMLGGGGGSGSGSGGGGGSGSGKPRGVR